MCGIAGFISTSTLDAGAPTQTVARIAASQRPRGPDHEGVATIEGNAATIVFGHNRLSIIDLSDQANQPMWDHEHRVCIVYNGEIYNYIELRTELEGIGHRFITKSDTEVILEAFKMWGIRSLDRLNGMFAFALWEADARRLWLVRDRFGVKPLYHATSRDGQLLFASTPGPLAREVGAQPNVEYVARGLRYWNYEDDNDISPYVGVDAVPAGHVATVDVADAARPRVTVSRWYDYAERVEDQRAVRTGTAHAALLDEFTDLLTHATRIRLRADVPIAVSLSGGLDSSSIAALVAGAGAHLIGFTYGDPADADSEAGLVARTAARLGMEVRYANPAAMDPAAFEASLDAQDAPFPDLSITAQYMVMRNARKSGIKVMLGGQGADEVLMGYRKFQVLLLRDALRERSPRSILDVARGLSLMALAEARRLAVYARQRDRYLRRAGLQTALRLPPVDVEMASLRGQPAWRRQLLDVTRLSLPTLLRYEDRNSTSNSLETRLPFLDYRLAELAGALPDRLKVRGGYGKWILRRAMRGLVSEEIRTARYKRGFDVARSRIAGTGIGDHLRAQLAECRPAVAEWLPANASIDETFSDRRLMSSATAFTEATSLLWLARRSS